LPGLKSTSIPEIEAQDLSILDPAFGIIAIITVIGKQKLNFALFARPVSPRLSNLRHYSLGRFYVLFGINLRNAKRGMTQHSLGRFQAELAADLGCRRMTQSVRGPDWHASLDAGAGNCTTVGGNVVLLVQYAALPALFLLLLHA
jgi:hypothetical protein